MRILIVGGGGREHALAWKLGQSSRVERIVCAPGNAGTEEEPKVTNAEVAASDLEGLVALARREAMDLTVVGPEEPLVAGIVDRFEAEGLACFGPHAEAARLEGSKAFAKAFMARNGVPTAAWGTFTDPAEAFEFADRLDGSAVIKADGLAAGKGVVLTQTRAECHEAIREILGGRFGSAGARVIVEERLSGEEASFIGLVDGKHVLPLASSQDHKPLYEGDIGPNTGGMGAYSPAPLVTETVHQRIVEEIIEPTVAGMVAEGYPYRGVLYAGLMVEAGRPRVLEFNCRLGDPECQALLMRLASDLVDPLEAVLIGQLDDCALRWKPQTALCLVQVAGGYPGAYEKGHPIGGLASVPDEAGLKVFHAGTCRQRDRVVTSGGRVLGITALGEDLAEARHRTLTVADRITWPGVHYRRDIGQQALAGD